MFLTRLYLIKPENKFKLRMIMLRMNIEKVENFDKIEINEMLR